MIKTHFKKTAALLALVISVICLCGCMSANNTAVEDAPLYLKDTELGDGTKTLTVDIVAPDCDVTFTIHTDKDNLGDALSEHSLIEGEQGAYGIYIKKANGILADYDVNKCYWAVTKDGEYLQTGADETPIADGEKYELTYTEG